jgi:hypothetical protein
MQFSIKAGGLCDGQPRFGIKINGSCRRSAFINTGLEGIEQRAVRFFLRLSW